MSTYNESDRSPETPGNEQSQPGAKKPYQKPAFRYEQVFETMALACGKVNATQSQCNFNRKS